MKKLIFCFLSLITLFGLLAACAVQEDSVAIIGGADGPTAILVSSPGGQKPLVIIGLIILFLAVVLYRIRKTRSEKPEDQKGQKPPGAL